MGVSVSGAVAEVQNSVVNNVQQDVSCSSTSSQTTKCPPASIIDCNHFNYFCKQTFCR